MAFWWMFLWVFAVWQLFQKNMSNMRRSPDGVKEYSVSTFYCVLIASVPLMFAALRSGFGDTGAYFGGFDGIPKSMSGFDDYVNIRDHSKLYYGLQMLFKLNISDDHQVWFGLIAVIQMYLVIKTLRKYSPDLGMSMFVFVGSSLIINWMFNGIRQFLAVTILFACTEWILQKKWYFFIPFAVFIMGLTPITSRLGLADPPWYLCGIHQSVLIFILGYFCINGKAFNKRVWIVAAVFVVLVISGALDDVLDSSVEDTTYVKDMGNVVADDGTSVLRVIVSSVPFIMALFARNEFNNPKTPPIIHLAVNASAITTVLYVASAFTSGIYVGRLPIYTEMYNLILVPWLIMHPYKKNAGMIKTILIAGYAAYFYYQINVRWGLDSYQSEILGILPK